MPIWEYTIGSRNPYTSTALIAATTHIARDIVLYNVFKFINLEIIYGTISKSSATRTASEYVIYILVLFWSISFGSPKTPAINIICINIIENATVIILPP